jgi:hypothetical protein
MKKSYSLASDLLVLATKTYKNGDIKGAAKLFAHACSCKDLPVFVNQALATEGDKGLTMPIIKRRVIASVEAAFQDTAGPIPPEELRRILSTLKSGAVHASADDGGFVATTGESEDAEDFDEELDACLSSMDNEDSDDFSLDADDEDATEEEMDNLCPDCDSDPCECEHETEGTMEEELSTNYNTGPLFESVKNSLVSLKVRSNDWEVKRFMPVLLKFFPDLALEGDMDSDIGFFVNKILNRLHKIDVRTLNKLDVALKPLREA